MKKTILFVLYLSISVQVISCKNGDESETTKSDSKKQEDKQSIENNPESNTEEFKGDFNIWLFDLSEITFESKLFENIEDAKSFLEEKGLTYESTYSPEENLTTLRVIMETEDQKNSVELNYQYYDEDGNFYDFRNIITKIEDDKREKTVKFLKETVDAETMLTAQKYKKKYGEEGYVWYEEGTGQAMQTILSYEGGNTDWIEIRRCNYFFVSKEEIFE